MMPTLLQLERIMNPATCPARWLAVLGTLILTAGPAQAQEFPPRKPGLWEITMIGTGIPPHTVKHCVDAKTDKQMQQSAQGLVGSCKPGRLQKEGAAFVFDQECSFGGYSVLSRSVTTGDFQSKIRTEVTSKFTPPLPGRDANKTAIDSQWTGACPAGWKPGDMEMPGGARANVNQLFEGLEKPPQKQR